MLRRFGAIPSKSDPCVYYIGQGEESLLIAVYVDDILVLARDLDRIVEMGKFLAQEFEMKDLGEPVVSASNSRDRITKSLYQKGYVTEILERFGMTDCKPVNSPMDVNAKLSTPADNPSDEKKLPYRELVGALMYLAIATRPDIAHAVSVLSQFNNCYEQRHWIAAKRVLRYLKGTVDFGLTFGSSDELLTGYVDADWAGCPIDRRSYTEFVFVLSGSVISWDSKKQRTVALSTTEAEFMGMTEAAKESIYLQSFLGQLGFHELTTVKLFNDNMGALKLTENHTFHSKSKHIDLRYHFIRDAIQKNHLKVKYISTDDMLANVMTKGLFGPKHRRCAKLMGLRSILPSGPTTSREEVLENGGFPAS